MGKVEDFLKQSEEEEIIKAIQQAEQQTSGEIRVHIENHSDNHNKRVMEVFHELEMTKTKNRNGVLLYIAVTDKYFYIYGDEGINKLVSDNFWDTTRDIMLHYFKKQQFKEGIVKAVLEIGKQLKQFFPYDKAQKNELSDDISYS